MSDKGILKQINASRRGRGGSCLILVQLQLRHLSAVHAASAEISASSALWLQSRCSKCVSDAKGARLSPEQKMVTLRRLTHEAKGDESATGHRSKLRVGSRGQRANTAMCLAPFAPSKSDLIVKVDGSSVKCSHASPVTHASTATLSLLQASRRLFFMPLHCCTTSSSRSG